MKIFSYGTLKSGFFRHSILQALKAEYLGDFTTISRYFVADLNFANKVGQQFPAMVETISSNTLVELGWHSGYVNGEVYEVPDEALEYLDSIEGGYIRKEIEVYQATDADGDDSGDFDANQWVTCYLMETKAVIELTEMTGRFTIEDFNKDAEVFIDWDNELSLKIDDATPPVSAEVIPIKRDIEVPKFAFNVVDIIPETILESAVVSVAKDEMVSTTVEGFQKEYLAKYDELKDEARYWLGIFNDALAVQHVEQD